MAKGSLRASRSTKQKTPELWRAVTIKASKARKHTRHWAAGPCGQSCGWFDTLEEAQSFCDQRNAAFAGG